MDKINCSLRSVASKKSILCQASEPKINSNKSKVPPIDLLLQHGNIKGCKWRVMQGRQWQCGELRAVYCISVATCSVQSGQVLVLVLAAEQEGKWLVQDKECTSSGQTSLLLSPRHPAVNIRSTLCAEQRLWSRRHCNTLTNAVQCVPQLPI